MSLVLSTSAEPSLHPLTALLGGLSYDALSVSEKLHDCEGKKKVANMRWEKNQDVEDLVAQKASTTLEADLISSDYSCVIL